jgi:hypothetical protein
VTAALAAGCLASDQPPITTRKDAGDHTGQNTLYDAWVDRIAITDLLRDQDLKDKAQVTSLLDSAILRKIADTGLDVVPSPARRPYVADDFRLLLTIMGRAEPPRMMKCRLAPDRSLTPTLSQRARERWCCANFIVTVTNLRGMPYSIPPAIGPSHGMSLGRTQGRTSRMGTSGSSPGVPPQWGVRSGRPAR